MKKLISMFTMKKVDTAFYDYVERTQLYYYIDKYGVKWLSYGKYFPFITFRTKSKSN